jgi:hypothetical protein
MYFNLDIESDSTKIFESELYLFRLILCRAKHLIDFTFTNRLSMTSNSYISIKTCVSSILTKLTINVNTFDDCLYLLDGRFNHLSTLIIDIEKISISISDIDNMVKIYSIIMFRTNMELDICTVQTENTSSLGLIGT